MPAIEWENVPRLKLIIPSADECKFIQPRAHLICYMIDTYSRALNINVFLLTGTAADDGCDVPAAGAVGCGGGGCLVGESNCALSRSLSRPNRNDSRSCSTRSSVGPHRWKPASFCSHTMIVPFTERTFTSDL